MHLFLLDAAAEAAALHAHKSVLNQNLSAHQLANAHLSLAALRKIADAKEAVHLSVVAHVAVNVLEKDSKRKCS
jgi:hypothetical protein